MHAASAVRHRWPFAWRSGSGASATTGGIVGVAGAVPFREGVSAQLSPSLPHSSHRTAVGHYPTLDENSQDQRSCLIVLGGDLWGRHLLSLHCRGMLVATTRLYWNCSATPTCYRRPTTRGLNALNALKARCRRQALVSLGSGFVPLHLPPGARSGTFLRIKRLV
jgi:hypothetical protein